jgi:predicted ATPase
MINRLHVKNFKCLRDLDVPLGPFTILIGPNDSGKSSLLDAIQLLGRTTKEPLTQVFAPPLSLDNLVWRCDRERVISWRVTGTAESREFSYLLVVSPQGQWTVEEELIVQGQQRLQLEGTKGQPNRLAYYSHPGGQRVSQQTQPGQTALFLAARSTSIGRDFVAVAMSLASSIKYRLNPELMRQEVTDLKPDPILDSSGSNLVKALDAVQNSADRSAFPNLEEALHQAIPTLQGAFLPLLPPAKRSLAFTLAGDGADGVSIPAALASDGALLITAILTLAYGEAPEILFFEEPENGLHYSLLKLAVDLLRKISTGAVGNRQRQVIVTTHSPLLLNFAKPEEVLVFRRSVEEGTKVTPLKEAPNIANLLREFGMGELWYHLGEEALVKEPHA